MMEASMTSISYQSEVRPAPAQTGQKRDRVTAGLGHHGSTAAAGSGPRSLLAPVESDSLNENNFPTKPVRDRDRTVTKRKRKCKRIALDPEQAGGHKVSSFIFSIKLCITGWKLGGGGSYCGFQ